MTLHEMATHAALIAQPVFERMGWRWWDARIVPTVEDIRKTFLDLARGLEVGGTASTGRLVVIRGPESTTFLLELGIHYDQEE